MTSKQPVDIDGKVFILLCTYNGEEHLSEQIESIREQSFEDWLLLVRDDGSTDATADIIGSFALRDQRIHKVGHEEGENYGAVGNFNCLMERAIEYDAAYAFFADQDDVWSPDKLETQLGLMLDMESRYPNEPIIIHTDLEVVGDDLDPISSSLMAYQKIHHQERDPLKVLLVQNFVTGCSAVVNRRLLELALPVPDTALMHDWWLALIAASSGHIGYIDNAFVKYRQHAANAVGAKSIWQYLNPFSLDWYRQWVLGRKNLKRTIAQAHDLVDRLDERTEGATFRLAREYADILKLKPMHRVFRIPELGVHAQSKLRHTLLLARLLTMK